MTNQLIGKVAWNCPSNIALVKYWGKKGFQLPSNPSLSMTLDKSVTQMEFNFEYDPKRTGMSFQFTFEGALNEKFGSKIKDYLVRMTPSMPFLEHIEITLASRNTFPHSAGIASSASAMGALALCLCSVEEQISGNPKSKKEFFSKASNLARMASGSASRSVYGGYAVWGESDLVSGSSDEFAVQLPFKVHPEFNSMKDAILIVSAKEKSVSSRAGHKLMDDHYYSAGRIVQVREHLEGLIEAMKSVDFGSFTTIVENEALSLHGLMLASNPSFLLMAPNTIEIINRIRAFRERTGIPVCFTLDAGPNVHLLYRNADSVQVAGLIREELWQYCEDGRWIDDGIGHGPQMY